jgi:predicted esterase
VPRSLLSYRDLRGDRGPESPLLLFLHGRGADDEQFVGLNDSLQPRYDACLVRAPVPLVPPTGPRSSAAERTWYLGRCIARAEPASFGNALWELERLLRDVRDREGAGRPLVLVGRDQGAVLCLTMACIAPDWLAGVIAFDGDLPVIDGWLLPAGDTGALPVLLVVDSETGADRRGAESAADEFRRRNAVVEIARADGVLADPGRAARLVSEWVETSVTRRE